MKRMKRVLIILVDREFPVENIALLRRQVMEQIEEGVLVLPSYCIGTVTDLDICGGEKDE